MVWGVGEVATAAHLSASLLLAFATALAVTPVAIRLARRTAFYDHPEGYKAHLAPTPYLGGAAVLTAFAAGALVVDGGHGEVGLILIGAVGLWVVGTLDDRRTLRPAYRLVAAALAAALLWANGLGWQLFPAEGANLAVTILWVVGLVNAFNLMDNMDGAAGAVASASGAGAAALALVGEAPHLAGLGLAVSGACLGFLRYNLASPARIFLGDGGSMPIGFVVAATLMALPVAEAGGSVLVSATFVVGLPIIDTGLVIVSRRRRRVAVCRGGRDHTTHRLLRVLPSPRKVAVLLAVVQALLCTAGLFAVGARPETTIAAAGLFAAGAVAAVVLLESPQWTRALLHAGMRVSRPAATGVDASTAAVSRTLLASGPSLHHSVLDSDPSDDGLSPPRLAPVRAARRGN
jgi:UDP-GlcNAc:undecaprenyl-phosphate/decaprenyl-phosphate GlcNAc-1-phosphate transferase